MPRDHRTAELRSIALHRLVAERLDASVLERTRSRVQRWIDDVGPVALEAALGWRELLDEPPASLASRLVEHSQQMRDLRQNTPFAGALTSRERWRVISEVQ